MSEVFRSKSSGEKYAGSLQTMNKVNAKNKPVCVFVYECFCVCENVIEV